MTVINHVNDDLFVKSILSNDLVELDTYDINDPDPESPLLNRVKKLSDDERKELKNGLNEIWTQINAPIFSTSPLQEKGLYALILADDGTRAKVPCCLSALIRKIRNLFGRVPSADLVRLLKVTRNDLKTKGYVQGDPFNAEAVLTTTIGAIKGQIICGNKKPAEVIGSLISEVIQAEKEFARDANKVWDEPATLFSFQNLTLTLQQTIGNTIPSIMNEVSPIFNEIFNLVQDRKTLDPAAFFTKYGQNITNETFVSTFVIGRLSLIKSKLNEFESSYDAKLKIFENRRKDYNDKQTKAQQNKGIEEARVQKGKDLTANADRIKKLQLELNNYEQICNLINETCKTMSDPRATLQSVRLALNVAQFNINVTPNQSLKTTQNIAQDLTLLKTVADTNFSMDKQPLANALTALLSPELSKALNAVLGKPENNQLSKFSLLKELDGDAQDSTYRSLLTYFISNPNQAIHSDDLEKKFIQDCFKFWEIIFNKFKDVKAAELKKVKEEQKQVEKRPVQAKLAGDSTAIQAFPVATVVSAVQQPAGTPLDTPGLISLSKIIYGLHPNLANEAEAEKCYKRVVPDTGDQITKDEAEAVYKNFYWILKDNNKLWGDIHQSGQYQGHSKDTAWGTKVFLGENKIPAGKTDISAVDLNSYRWQALDQVLRKKVRNNDGQLPA